MTSTTSKPTNKTNFNKTSDSETSPWNTLGISKNTLRLNFIGLNKEEEDNP